MNPHEFVDNIRNKIAKGQLDLALKNLSDFLKDKKLFYNEIISLSGRYAELKQEQNAGHLLPQEYKVQQAKIRTALLELLDEVEKKTTKPIKTTDKPKPNLAWIKFVGIGVIVLAIGYVASQKVGGNRKKTSKITDTTKAIDSTKLIDPKLGRIANVDFPRLENIAVKVGDKVMAPVLTELEKQANNPKTKVSLSYTTVTVVAPGTYQTIVKSGTQTGAVPNAYLIPLSSKKPKKGDLFFDLNLLGRFVMVDERNLKKVTTGVVLSGEKPSHKWVSQATQLNMTSRSFLIVKDGIYPGSTIACKEGTQYIRGTVINQSNDKILVKVHTRTLKIFAKSTCTSAPLNPRLKTGEYVWVPKNGIYQIGQITRINTKLRRVYVKRANNPEEVYFIGTVFKKGDLE